MQAAFVTIVRAQAVSGSIFRVVSDLLNAAKISMIFTIMMS